MSIGRSDQGLSNDHIAMMVLGCVAIGVLYAKRGPVLAGASGWLVDHQLLTNHNTIITIPHLGGLDLARVLVLVGLLVVGAVIVGIAVRRTSNTSRESSPKTQQIRNRRGSRIAGLGRGPGAESPDEHELAGPARSSPPPPTMPDSCAHWVVSVSGMRAADAASGSDPGTNAQR